MDSQNFDLPQNLNRDFLVTKITKGWKPTVTYRNQWNNKRFGDYWLEVNNFRLYDEKKNEISFTRVTTVIKDLVIVVIVIKNI